MPPGRPATASAARPRRADDDRGGPQVLHGRHAPSSYVRPPAAPGISATAPVRSGEPAATLAGGPGPISWPAPRPPGTAPRPQEAGGPAQAELVERLDEPTVDRPAPGQRHVGRPVEQQQDGGGGRGAVLELLFEVEGGGYAAHVADLHVEHDQVGHDRAGRCADVTSPPYRTLADSSDRAASTSSKIQSASVAISTSDTVGQATGRERSGASGRDAAAPLGSSRPRLFADRPSLYAATIARRGSGRRRSARHPG